MGAVKSKIIYLPVKPPVVDVQFEEWSEERKEEQPQESSGILPDILLSLYAVGWGVWMFPYSLLLGSVLLVSAGALSWGAFLERMRS